VTCPTTEELVEERINRILTQYRESPKLLHLLRTYLGAVAQTALQVCDLPERFDLNTAVGDQLTLIGKRLGWPRCHCVCDISPVFGFECADEISLRPIVGFNCDDTYGGVSSWAECASGISEICLNDDEIYRKFLQVRVYQHTARFDLASLEEALRIFFGPTAYVLYSGQGRVVVSPGRDLTDQEILLLQLYPRVMPLALGVEVRFHFGEQRVFGFGEGWGGFSEESEALTQAGLGFQRTGKVFGFCDDWGGFCEDWKPDGLPIVTEQGKVLMTENNEPILTGPLTEDANWMCRVSAPWMCEIDVQPYSC
jgi:hypothetical protein